MENLIFTGAATVFCSVLILLLGAVGIFLIVSSLRSRKKAEASQGWLNTSGRITTAEIKRSVNRDDDGNESYAYYPAMTYDYEVRGQHYTGKRITFGNIVANSNQAKVAAELARYPVDGEVTVYYNPEKPSEAVLERKAGGSTWGLVVGIILLSLGACITCGLLFGWVRDLSSF
jgi:hypothetical protein